MPPPTSWIQRVNLPELFHGELTQSTPPSEKAGRWQIQENFAPITDTTTNAFFA